MTLEPNSSRSQDPSVPSVTTAGHQAWNRSTKPFKAEFDFKDMTVKKYICGQCWDEFLHESSLTTHLERRSLVLNHFCDHCNQKLLFFNRCALLSHVRSHVGNTPIDHILSKVVVQPIGLKELLRRTAVTKSGESNSKPNGDNNVESIRPDVKRVVYPVVTRTTSDSAKCPPQVIRAEKKNNVTNNSIDTKLIIKKTNNSELKCSQCKCSFNSLWTREQHFSGRQLALPMNQCRVCPAICATTCSQSLHTSLHTDTDTSDVYCPECGIKLDDSDVRQLLTHIIIDCLHLSRRLTYICMYCTTKTPSLSDSVQHMKSVHTSRFWQCDQCPGPAHSLMSDQAQFDQHQTHAHQNTSQAVILFKCPICGSHLNSSNSFCFHLTSTHRKKFDDFTSFVFVCLDCDQSFATKSDLKSHINIDHIKDKTEIQTKDYFKHLTQEMTIKFKIKSNFCLDNTSDASKGKNNFPNNKDSKVLDNSKEKSLESNELVSKRIKIVDKNDIKGLTDPQSNPQSTANDNWFECRECGLNFPFVQTLKRHLILEHRIHDVESYINTTYIKIPIAAAVPQMPKEVGEEKLSQIMTDSEHSTDTLCPICSQTFSDSKELKIHGRVHGLAFIKSCQKKLNVN